MISRSFDNVNVRVAILSLTHSKKRLCASIVAIAFSVILMFVEIGFLNGIYDSQTEFIRMMDADILMVHRHKIATVPSLSFPHRRTIQARSVPGILSAHSVAMAEYPEWKNRTNGRSYPIRVFAFDPNSGTFASKEIRKQQHLLREPDTVLIDCLSRDFYGKLEKDEKAELANNEVRIVGTFRMGPNVRTEGNVLTSERTFARIFLRRGMLTRAGDLPVEFGLLKLMPDADYETVIQALEERMPCDVRFFGKYDFIRAEELHWRDDLAAGGVFGVGVAIGLVIGMSVCYQVLYSEVMDRLPEFATLKALGYSDGRLTRMVIYESLLLAIFGFVPGVICSFGIYSAMQTITRIQTQLSLFRILPILAATLCMCVFAGIAASLKLRSADPVELFE